MKAVTKYETPILDADFSVDKEGFVAGTGSPTVTRSSLQSRSDDYSLRIKHQSGAGQSYAQRTLTVEPSTTYEVTAWSWHDSFNTRWMSVDGDVIADDVGKLSASLGFEENAKKWVKHTMLFKTTSTASTVNLMLGATLATNAVVFWDDVKVQEPSWTALAKIKKELRRSYIVNASLQTIAEWNYNRYVKTTVDSAIGEKQNAFSSKLYPISSITEPRRPGQGIAKARIASGRNRPDTIKPGVISDGYNDKVSPRKSYIASKNDIYKYWCSAGPATNPATNNGEEVWTFNKDDDADAGNGGSDDTDVTAIVLYEKAVDANKIVIQFEATYAKPAVFRVELRSQVSSVADWGQTFEDNSVLKNGRLELYYQGNEQWSPTGKAFARKAPDSECTMPIKAISLHVEAMEKNKSFAEVIEVGARLERDVTADIESVSSDMEMSDESAIVPMGQATSNTGTISLDNTSFRWTKKSGLYYGMTDYGVKFTNTYLFNVNGNVIKVRDFEMYSDSAWTFDDLNASISLRDYSLFLQDIKPHKVLYENITVGKAIWQLCDMVGFTNYAYDRPADKKTTRIDWFWTDGEMTIWEIFAELSYKTQTAVYFNGYGELQIKTREEVYNELANPEWTFLGDDDGVALADIISSTSDRTFNSNKINVHYQPTDTSNWRNGYPVMAEAWVPEEETVMLRATPLKRRLTRGGRVVKIGKDDAKIWPYESLIQVDAEIMRYDGKGYIYYDKNKKRKHVYINSAQELKTIRKEKAHQALVHKGYFTGSLRVVDRGVWGTCQRQHKINVDGWHLSYTSHQIEGLTVWGSGDSKPKKKKKKKKKKHKLQGFTIGGKPNKKKARATGFTASDNDDDSRRLVGQIGEINISGSSGTAGPKKPKRKKKKHPNGTWDPIKGKKKKGVGRIRMVAGESNMRIATSSRFASNQRFLVRRGRVLDRPMNHLGCRIKFNKGDYKDQKAGICFNSQINGTAYYVELTPTKKINAKQQKKRGEVMGYITDGHEKVAQIGGPDANMALVEDIWYDIDIDWSNNSGYHQFDVYVNGSLKISETIPPGINPSPSGMFGMFAVGHTNVDVEYFYGFNRKFAVEDYGQATFYDKIQGGYVEDRFWREWVWNKKWIIPKKDGLLMPSTIVRGSQYFFDEFGSIVREIRKFDAKFEVPQQYTELFFDNEEEVMCPSYNSDSFGAEWFLINTKRNNVVVHGEDTREWNGETISRVMKILGREVKVGEEKTETVEDAEMINRRGEIVTDVQSTWLQSKEEAKALGEWLKGRLSTDFNQHTLEVFGNPLFEVGDVVSIKHIDIREPTNKYVITALSNSWGSGGLSTTVTMRRVTASAIM